MSDKLTDQQRAAVKKVHTDFEKAWQTHDLKLATLTSTEWHKEKGLAGVQKAKWFQKSNNIGPKLDKMQTVRAKFNKQINHNNYMSIFNALQDLEKSLDAFDKNRKGSDDAKDTTIKKLVDDYSKITNSAAVFLAGQQKQVKILDQFEGQGAIHEAVPI